MKSFRFLNLALIGLVVALSATACRKKPQYLTDIPAGRTPRPGGYEAPPQPLPITPQPVVTEAPTTALKPPTLPDFGNTPLPNPEDRKNWRRDRDVFKANMVHFAFDSSVVPAADKKKIDAVAAHLKANPKQALEIEGHCDERGTEEYNRALGERRALAVREELLRLGIETSRIDTTSYGKDRPLDTAHNEAAWKQNRRGEFLLELPPQ